MLEPAGGEAAPEGCQLFQAHRLGRRRYEGALSWASNGQPLLLEIAVGLEHGVGVDRERGDDVLHPWQLVSVNQIAEAQRVLDLVDELKVRRDARARLEAEHHRRDRHLRLAYLFIYPHR